MRSSLNSHAEELKQQGAIEAAQDANSQVTAQDAEKIMVDESKKGGAVAFQFDPDASPQEKAALAGAVSMLLSSAIMVAINILALQQVPAGFHRRKQSGVGIVTDMVRANVLQAPCLGMTPNRVSGRWVTGAI